MLTRGTGQGPVSYSPMTGRPRLCLRRGTCGERRAQLALRSFSSASGALRATDSMPFSMPAADGLTTQRPAPAAPLHRQATKKPPSRVASSLEGFTWHRAIFAGGYPPTIVAAAAFHARVRDGSGWDHNAMDTRIEHPSGEP